MQVFSEMNRFMPTKRHDHMRMSRFATAKNKKNDMTAGSQPQDLGERKIGRELVDLTDYLSYIAETRTATQSDRKCGNVHLQTARSHDISPAQAPCGLTITWPSQ